MTHGYRSRWDTKGGRGESGGVLGVSTRDDDLGKMSTPSIVCLDSKRVGPDTPRLRERGICVGFIWKYEYTKNPLSPGRVSVTIPVHPSPPPPLGDVSPRTPGKGPPSTPTSPTLDPPIR